MKQQYQAYVAATQTVAKTQQILMLYDGVVRLIQQSKEAIKENRIEDRFNLLIKASTVIQGLQGCLDFENGKEIAGILYSFYSSVDTRLYSIHRTNSLETCDEVIHDLKQMRDAWASVDEADMKARSPVVAPVDAPPIEITPPKPGTNIDPTVTLSA